MDQGDGAVLKRLHANAEAFTRQHLQELAAEVVQWHSTGVLIDGRVRELARSMTYMAGGERLSLAESMITAAALRQVADCPAVNAASAGEGGQG